MLLAGDEFGRTQGGNNNPYNQDNETSWLDWDIGARGEQLIRFVQELTSLRHRYPVLRRGRYLTGELDPVSGVRDVTWLTAMGEEMRGADWNDGNLRCFGMLLDGRARATGVRRASSDSSMLIVLNAHHEGVGFVLPAVAGGTVWRLVFDTNAPNHVEDVGVGDKYVVTGRAVLLFERVREFRGPEQRKRSPRRRTHEADPAGD